MSASEGRPAYVEEVDAVFGRMKLSPAHLLREFHAAADATMNTIPTLPDPAVIDCRNLMSEEERDESMVAHGDALALASADGRDPGDVEEVIAQVGAELADEVYVAYGTALAFGIDLDAVIADVHAANMRKVKHDVKKRKDGKVEKPKGWRGPDARRVIFGG